MDPELVFTTSSQGPLCRVVTLVNDDISEGTEFFLIVMSTSMERVGLDDAAGVTVSDDDSEYNASFLHKQSLMFHLSIRCCNWF